MIARKFILTLFSVVFFFYFDLETQDNDSKTFICADEVSPLLEFSIPKFEKNLITKKILLKVFSLEDRNIFTFKNALIQKKSSHADRSYFFYIVKFDLNDKESEGYFEFYPPSHLMFRNEGSSFSNLVCWE